MKSIKKTILTAGLFVMAATLPLSANEYATFTDSPNLKTDNFWGVSRNERYDVAVHLGDSQLTGGKITQITFPWKVDDGFSDVQIWLSKELKIENKVNIPDILSEEAKLTDGKMTLKLSQPYTITDEGVYVGLSFTIDENTSDNQKTPVATLKTEEDVMGVGFMIHTSSTYSNRWKDLFAENKEVPVVEVNLENLAENSAVISLPEEIYLVKGETSEVPVTVKNYGMKGIESLGIRIKSTSFDKEAEIQHFPENVRYIGYPVETMLSMPPIDDKGNFDIEVTADKVNGSNNELAAIGEDAIMYICSSRPVHKPLFEEYTGTGCGYCPRGAIGMERLKEMYGDKFVGVAYHCKDIMSIAAEEDYPNYAPSQPDSFLDRYVQADPYFGQSGNFTEFEIDKVWAAQEKIFSPVHFTVNCEWTDESKESLNVKSDFSFVRDYEESDFRIVYILLSNGLKGEGKNWLQGNYYSGQVGKWPAEFDELVNSTNPMPNMTYDHVAICMPEKDGIKGSIPSIITADTPMSHSYTFNLSDAVNLGKESLVQDKDNIYVVAAIVDGTDGHVVNCTLAIPGEKYDSTPIILGEIVKKEYISLSGARISAPQPGSVFIELNYYSDGSVKAYKRIK